ncbi:Protein of unknown function [Gryllus bimaculatus]|nr:Protein of unknown function [Gryllus bimaculatus]
MRGPRRRRCAIGLPPGGVARPRPARPGRPLARRVPGFKTRSEQSRSSARHSNEEHYAEDKERSRSPRPRCHRCADGPGC